MAPPRRERSGWKSAPRPYLLNYGSSARSLYETPTQNADYRGVEEAAGFETPCGVSHNTQGHFRRYAMLRGREKERYRS